MPKVEYEFARDIGQEVQLKALEQKGRVDALLVDSSGCQYRIIYWFNGERRSTWVYEWELS